MDAQQSQGGVLLRHRPANGDGLDRERGCQRRIRRDAVHRLDGRGHSGGRDGTCGAAHRRTRLATLTHDGKCGYWQSLQRRLFASDVRRVLCNTQLALLHGEHHGGGKQSGSHTGGAI